MSSGALEICGFRIAKKRAACGLKIRREGAVSISDLQSVVILGVAGNSCTRIKTASSSAWYAVRTLEGKTIIATAIRPPCPLTAIKDYACECRRR